ncbi:ferritin-like domain-containing protein [Allorhizocola rhizosphaerae]|uniref:ferritin-like domain-containing protein n=1 Tax=Allorhizocola rhizosphaerae TaxID=1872709 RepID=UPI000E3E92EB|nr:ferritin-like domain-containing protein [Allorhizocola rhizosphaerae]
MSERLRAALAAEHAAIFGYGRLGVYLDADGKAEARAAEAVHRARRDTLVVKLDELKLSPAPAESAYLLPFPVTDAASAMKLAVHLEEGVAATWRAAIKTVEGQERRTAVEAYSDAAVRATRWRRRAGITPLTTPFPGRTG